MKLHFIISLFFIFNVSFIFSQEKLLCPNWGEVDTYPIYMDTIPFSKHILHGWRYPYPERSFVGKLFVSFNIDTCGKITDVEFKGRITDCQPCVKNALEILQSAKLFIPATKNNKLICSSVIFPIPYDNTINLFRSPFHWYLSPKDSSIVDIFDTDLELTDFLSNNSYNRECVPLEELDEPPIYKDTIPFNKHVSYDTWKKPSNYLDFTGRYVVSVEIDTLGQISKISILDDNAHCEECLKNVYKILQTAKLFTPGKKNGKPVCSFAIFAIPYDNRIIIFQSPFYKYMKKDGTVVEDIDLRLKMKRALKNKSFLYSW